MAHPVTALADQAAAAVHELAHLTRPAITTLQVSDLPTLTAALADLAAGLPQTLHQLGRYLPDGLTLTDDPRTGDPTLDHAGACLRHAAAAAAHAAGALQAAHQSLGDLAETTQTAPEGVNIQPTKRGQISTGVDIVECTTTQ
jgi:ABC-type transporter Mla subunit MlaD